MRFIYASLFFLGVRPTSNCQAFQTLPEPQNGPYGHAQKTGIWYHNDGGREEERALKLHVSVCNG